MKNKAVVGFTLPEASALLGVISGRFDLEALKDSYRDAKENHDVTHWGAEEYMGRIVKKLEKALPVMFYYMELPTSVVAPKTEGPFATHEAAHNAAILAAHKGDWNGTIIITAALNSAVEGETQTYHRGELEALWEDVKLPFKSQIHEDDVSEGAEDTDVEADTDDEEEQPEEECCEWDPDDDYDE